MNEQHRDITLADLDLTGLDLSTFPPGYVEETIALFNRMSDRQMRWHHFKLKTGLFKAQLHFLAFFARVRGAK